MQNEGYTAPSPIDQEDVELLRYMRRAFSCRHVGGDCPALPDCPEGFYLCDAIANMLAPGDAPALGNTAKTALRFLYSQVDCDASGDCPSRARCGEGERDACARLLLKLGVT